MSRETKMGCPAASVVLEALEVAVRAAVAEMDQSGGQGCGVWPKAKCDSSRRSNSVGWWVGMSR
ncbi:MULTISPECIES: hypothetical protein [unclassified Rhodococcus (in: high G+C Gram-positive bacteria)]|uniref:hypothetical protein n=1 Tax=unclassified Rhodococcus (in: high G+C Gram-positive bacteria) TaxID=192944 RepID=UPI0005D376BE|nr:MULTISPECIES: hypothetical protein [unclassified Rhodococcus (in: high G+C Gram-positive bacteria)]KJF19202.1 hypothetical protein SZ00_06129 [Rhodococcus sp. AD45]RZL20883.1 MAG: hypothetical protein EOP31_30580 [Rhodococcus sp. (in: high G+C Gram-positive bacteria)]